MRAMNEGRFTYLDLTSDRRRFGETEASGVKLVRNDIDRILYETINAMEETMVKFPDAGVIFCIIILVLL